LEKGRWEIKVMVTTIKNIIRKLTPSAQIFFLAILLSFVMFGPLNAEAGVLFQSSWDTATGTSDAAIFDGGKWFGGPLSKGKLQDPYVSSGGPGGHNYLNMVTVGQGGWGGDGRCFEWLISGGNNGVIWDDPDDLYMRFYYRVDASYDVPHPTKHWFQGVDSSKSLDHVHYNLINKPSPGEIPGAGGGFAIEIENQSAGRFQSDVRMEKERWYCYEIQIHKVSASQERWYIRLDGVDITDSFHGIAGSVYGKKLDEWYASGNGWPNEYHGNLWLVTYDMLTLNEGWDVTAIEVRDDRWPGLIDGPPPVDTTPPTGSIEITGVEGLAARTSTIEVTLALSATDTDSGMGFGAQMQFSNDRATWSSPEPYAQSKAWTLLDTAPGTEQARTVYVKFKDVAGNWSNPVSSSIVLDKKPPNPPLW
jgi:hypothetical protein